MEPIKEVGRIVSGAYYDHQEVRTGAMNRIRDVIRKKNDNIEFDAVEEKKEKKTFDKKYQDTNLDETLKEMLEEKKLTPNEHNYMSKMIVLSNEAKAMEERYKSLMMQYIVEEPIWNEFLGKVKGLGPVLSANLIKNFGYCEKFAQISSLWKYCGFHVVNGVSVKRKKNTKLDFNIKMRTLCWKIGDSFMKQNSPIYRQIYDNEKKRQMSIKYKVGELAKKYEKSYTKGNNPYKESDTGLILGHAHNRALRKMVKIFLSHYWVATREITNQEITKPYVEGVLKHKHIIKWQDVVTANNEARENKKPKLKKIKGKK